VFLKKGQYLEILRFGDFLSQDHNNRNVINQMNTNTILFIFTKFQKIGSVRQYLDILRLGDFCPKTVYRNLLCIYIKYFVIEKIYKKIYKLIFQSFLAVLKMDMSFFDFPGELWTSFLMKFFLRKIKIINNETIYSNIYKITKNMIF
jgi:hypothetical protein